MIDTDSVRIEIDPKFAIYYQLKDDINEVFLQHKLMLQRLERMEDQMVNINKLFVRLLKEKE